MGAHRSSPPTDGNRARTVTSGPIQALHAIAPHALAAALAGVYEDSPWVVERVIARRPFRTLAGLKYALAQVVREASDAEQLALLRAHPELGGRAMIGEELTPDSRHEQDRAGLARPAEPELARLRALNAAYAAKFGFPFILAVRGPRGTGLTPAEILATLERRLGGAPRAEQAEALRNVHRIAEMRIDERLGTVPAQGNAVWDWAAALAAHSDAGAGGNRPLTVTYLTPAHRACAADLARWMRADCGFDEVGIDAVGNVVGVYQAARNDAPRLLTGSHYDTVRNAGRYDGRLGVLVPMACVRELARSNRRLPFALEVVAFSEEEGQRYRAVFLGSSALAGTFDPAWLDQRDADGITMREAMRAAGLDPAAIAGLRREPARYLGFVEVHIEQGPVLTALDLPLGVVSTINGSVRYMVDLEGVAAHAGTTPMDQRQDAAAGAAELVLAVERCARAKPHLVGTVGMLAVPDGSINVVPGRCRLSLDLRAPDDTARDVLAADVHAALDAICARRGLRYRIEETMRAAAAPCAPAWQARWAGAVEAVGLPVHCMPSGAGHDSMKLHEIMPQGMLFVRGQNGGISHNPLECVTAHDADLAVQAFARLLHDLAKDLA
jgi:N-carbamoyl-L-amino-acid hydrolase